MRQDVWEIVQTILDRAGAVTPRALAEAAGFSRQSASAHLGRLVAEGRLNRYGRGRAIRYEGAPHATVPAATGATAPLRERTFATRGLEEHEAWKLLEADEPALRALPKRASETAYFAFTELLNNAIDHSESANARVAFGVREAGIIFTIEDDGIGALRRIQQARSLASPLEALQELSKGKLTTARERHSGLGIFFSSKVADLFALSSDGIRWLVDNRNQDVAVFDIPPRRGTSVRFEVDYDSPREVKAVIDSYSNEYEVARTKVTVKLFKPEGRYVSRSEAKVLLRGLDQFEEILLDFTGVEGIGQAFADEIFRVWASRHPRIKLSPINMGPATEFMVKLARGAQ